MTRSVKRPVFSLVDVARNHSVQVSLLKDQKSAFISSLMRLNVGHGYGTKVSTERDWIRIEHIITVLKTKDHCLEYGRVFGSGSQVGLLHVHVVPVLDFVRSGVKENSQYRRTQPITKPKVTPRL